MAPNLTSGRGTTGASGKTPVASGAPSASRWGGTQPHEYTPTDSTEELRGTGRFDKLGALPLRPMPASARYEATVTHGSEKRGPSVDTASDDRHDGKKPDGIRKTVGYDVSENV